MRARLVFIAVFSLFINLLMLTGPLFMLQVYDRVLSSRSEATLVALFVLVAFLYLAMGVLDFVRGRIGARIGADFQARHDLDAFRGSLSAPPEMRKESMTALGDVEAVRRFFSAPVFGALFDVPFTPLFIAAIFLFHPLLGWLAVGGALTMITLSLLNQALSASPAKRAAQTAASATRYGETLRMEPDTVRALGMTETASNRWREKRSTALETDMTVSDLNGGFGSISKAIRLFLQSAMLALGAWLVLQDQLTPGAMIAGSILLGRALAPVEQIIGGWALVTRARAGWASLRRLAEAVPKPPKRTRLNPPAANLEAASVSVYAPGRTKPLLSNINFKLEPGSAVGVIGESASGKSTLARVLTGLWQPATGSIRLDGASLDQFGRTGLAEYVGYLPQEIVLFDGTVAENISRLAENPDPKAIIAAAERAGAHDMILGLPDGYDSRVGDGGIKLSGGQKQRIGLARAMFGDPVILVLDEPNSNLDAAGSAAVNRAIREMKENGRIVIVMAHRPAAIAECTQIMMIRDGKIAAFGPKDDVLREVLRRQDSAPDPAAPPPARGAEVVYSLQGSTRQ
ncbi:type I secretion system permease/ATPase [Tropicimonas sp. S265A]|uniref:type I secretion system permease/ATPase n=1 Tax=Tropicimonas sp. S265A TaxID=3415134 RepID=UPI003C7C3AF6